MRNGAKKDSRWGVQLVTVVSIAAKRAEVHLRFKDCQSLNLIRAVMMAQYTNIWLPR